MTEKQLMALSKTMAKAATRMSRLRGGSQDKKIGCKKYFANVNDTAAFLKSERVRVSE